jgi:hypothetical protein
MKSPFEFLLLNSKTFYSKNLELFLNDTANILTLAYGKKWKVSVLLNVLEQLNIFIADHKEESEIEYDDLEAEDVELTLLNNLISYDFNKLEDKIITIDILELLRDQILDQIEIEVIQDV